MVAYRMGWQWRSAWCLAALLVALSLAERPAYSEVLTIGAAHSLKPVLREVLPIFESRYQPAKVHVIYGPSRTQREQIAQGAPLDVFLPASFDQVSHLQSQGLTIDGPPRIYARTSVVLIASAETAALPVSFQTLGSDAAGRIAVANPATDALGAITAQLMSNVDPAKRLQSRIIYDHHSKIIGLVSSGEADVGIVYRVDALHNRTVRILDDAPDGLHAPVELGAAVVWTCKPATLPLARKLLDFMLDPAVQHVLRKHGFQPLSSQME